MSASEKFPLSTFPPEHMGISSASILRFLDRLDSTRVCMHSYALIRHGAIVSEGYWAPFTEDSLHRMYSISKSFTSVAVGLLAQDGYIHLDDPIVQYFPDKVSKQLHPYTAAMTIRDVLRMATVHTKTATQIVPHPDMLKAFFNVTPSHESGTVFNYDTSGSICLAALVERCTGMDMLDYLRMKALGKIGFSEEAYFEKTNGISNGGGGLLCTTHDLAKFAQLCLQQGNWYGFQLLPKEYIRMATSYQIATHFAQPGHGGFGYGYQFWMTDHNGFALYGMGGQLAICLPKEDLILVTTADTLENPGGIDLIFNAFWDTIYADLQQDSIAEDEEASARLYERTASLHVRHVQGESDSPLALIVGGKTYQLDKNPSVLKALSVGFGPDYGVLELDIETGSYELRFGFGHNVLQAFPETGFRCLVSGAWVDPETLFIRAWIVDANLGSVQFLLHFGQDGSLSVSSRAFGDSQIKGYDTCTTGFIYK